MLSRYIGSPGLIARSSNFSMPTFRTALQTQRVCDAILRSAKAAQWVETGVAA